MSAILRIENLDSKISRETLKSIIDVLSTPQSVYIRQHNGKNLGFVNFRDFQVAEQVRHALDDRNLCCQKISVMWHEPVVIHVSDLAPHITSNTLMDVFQEFHVCHVELLDHNRASITFLCREDAKEAMKANNKTGLFSNTRWEWSIESQATSSTHSRRSSSNSDFSVSSMSYQEIFAQTPLHNTHVCISNLPKKTISQDIVPHLQQYGSVSHVYIISDQRRAIVKLDTHANAATAIFALNATMIAGRKTRLSWAKEKQIKLAESHYHLSMPPLTLLQPTQAIDQLLTNQQDHTKARPPAPAISSDIPSHFHGWNQYDQNYYMAF
ncbi:hypothetical protein BD560DRAFT_445799 [Blakeslea trispora]|nr:hypothetical protein BD560DRAFT_445799 [Blakeslea trispora]